MLRTGLLALALVASTAAASAVPEAGDLRILLNEVLYNPAGPDAGNEAVEIANPTPLPVDLAGYTLEDDDACRIGNATVERYRHALSGAIAPFGLLVVKLPSVGSVPKCLSLANGGDVVVLRDPAGAEVDRVAWPANAPADARDGWSIQRAVAGGWAAGPHTLGAPNVALPGA